MLSSQGERPLETSAQSPLYEVRCYPCRCSFAPGTKRCVHCGGKLGPPPSELPFGRPPVEGSGEDEAEMPVPSFARGVLWVLSAGVAIALSAIQTCGR